MNRTARQAAWRGITEVVDTLYVTESALTYLSESTDPQSGEKCIEYVIAAGDSTHGTGISVIVCLAHNGEWYVWDLQDYSGQPLGGTRYE